MARGRNKSPTFTVSVSDETSAISAVDVEVKVAGVDLKKLSSNGKSFSLNGKEQPMSRFGSLVFQKSDDAKTRKICIDGGIIPSLTWGLQQMCPEVEVWVKDVSQYHFSLQLKDGYKRSVLEKIARGNVAKDLEIFLRKRIPKFYAGIRVRAIRILAGSNKTTDLHEYVATLMSKENYAPAYDRLKKMIDNDLTDSERVQILIRTGICCLELDKKKEIKDLVVQIQRITESITECAPPKDLFMDDIATFAEKLDEAKMHTYAANVSLACNIIIHNIKDPNELLNKLLSNIMVCCNSLMGALSRNPMARLKSQLWKYVQELDSEVERMKHLNDCDPLMQSRAVYYSLHALNGTKGKLCEATSKTLKARTAWRFACVESAWADFTNILSLEDQFPDIALMLCDPNLMKTVREICDNPVLLEKRIMDPRIATINTMLNQELFRATPMTAFTDSETGRFEFEIFDELPRGCFGRSDQFYKKKKSVKEKAKGDEAYKKKQYDKALEHYEKAIELDPSAVLPHCEKAAVYISKNQLRSAEECCRTAMRIVESGVITDNKDIGKIHARLARVAFLSRNYGVSLELYQTSLRLYDDLEVCQQMKECEEIIAHRRLLQPASGNQLFAFLTHHQSTDSTTRLYVYVLISRAGFTMR